MLVMQGCRLVRLPGFHCRASIVARPPESRPKASVSRSSRGGRPWMRRPDRIVLGLRGRADVGAASIPGLVHPRANEALLPTRAFRLRASRAIIDALAAELRR
jgi:hypothetical protein